MHQISVTITCGRGSEKHNHDLSYRESLDHTHTADQPGAVIELLQYRSYKEQINDLMKPYIDDYNRKQQERYAAAWERYNSGKIKTKPRKANYKPTDYDYFEEHKNDTYYDQQTKRQEPLPIWRSIILGLGDKYDRQNKVITEEEAVAIFREIVKHWPELYPDFKLLGATIHLDEEGFYHCHIDYKPMYEHDVGQGLAVGIGQESALEHMGYEPEQSLINASDKIPIRFNGFRNRLYLEVEKELNRQGLGLLYGASKVKEPEKDSSRNQRLENWQATQDAALQMQLMKNRMLDIVQRDEVSPEGYKMALEAFESFQDTLHQVEEQPRSRLNKNNVVVDFRLFDQLRSIADALIDSISHLLHQLDVYRDNLDAEMDKVEELERQLEPLQQYANPDFKMHYAAIRARADRVDRLEYENRQLRQQLGIENKKDRIR